MALNVTLPSQRARATKPHLNGAVNGSEPAEEAGIIDLRKARLRARLRTPAEIRIMEPPPPIVPGWLSKGDLAIIYGSPKAAKSLVIQDLANSRGTGRTWLGLPAVPGTTLYMAAEGIGGLGKRIRAWESYNGVDVAGVHYLPGSVNLLDETTVCDIAELAKDLGVDLVVVDTVARTMVGGDENGPKDMNKLIAGLDHIREETNALACGIHHAGKDETKGMRGHSALLGAVDCVLFAQKAGSILTVTAEAMRDFEPPIPLQATLLPHLDSVVLEPIASVANGMVNHPALDCLKEIEDPGGISAAVWKAASGLTDRTFFRARKELVTKGLVVNIGTEKQPRYKPAAAAVLGRAERAADPSLDAPF